MRGSQPRDLDADIAYVEGFLQEENSNLVHATIQFVDTALTGWPYAIKRAMDAEKEIDRLRNELNILQEQGRRCWD